MAIARGIRTGTRAGGFFSFSAVGGTWNWENVELGRGKISRMEREKEFQFFLLRNELLGFWGCIYRV